MTTPNKPNITQHASQALDTVTDTVKDTANTVANFFQKQGHNIQKQTHNLANNIADNLPKPSAFVPDLFKPTTSLQPQAILPPNYLRHHSIHNTQPSPYSKQGTPERQPSRPTTPHKIVIESYSNISDTSVDDTLHDNQQYASIQTEETYDYRIGEYNKRQLDELEQKDIKIKRRLQKREQIQQKQKQAKTLFGATVDITVNDEVRLTIWILLIVASVICLAFFIYQSVTGGINLSAFKSPNGEQGLAVIIGGVFATLATLLSIIQIKAHYRHWVHPPSQRCVVRILFMVPVYSLSAWSSCAFLEWSLYIDFVRVAYEAFVVYTFMLLLTKYLGGHEGVSEALQYKTDLPWPAPMNWCLRPVKPTVTYLNWMKYGTLQYTLCAPVLSLMAVVLNMYGLYGDGEIDFSRGYVYVSWILNCSQMLALYCLVWLYITLKNELAPFNPMYKFLVVKGVVFFTFWQSVGIAMMVHFGYINSITCDPMVDINCTQSDSLSVGEVQVLLQDFIVCVEMFIAAAVHKYTFGYETYANGTMTLLMEQRAIRLAEITYQRAVEAQRRADAIERGEDPDLMAPIDTLKITELSLDERAVLDQHIKQHLEQQNDSDLLVAESDTGLAALLPWDESDMTSEFHQRSYGNGVDVTEDIELANIAIHDTRAKLQRSQIHTNSDRVNECSNKLIQQQNIQRSTSDSATHKTKHIIPSPKSVSMVPPSSATSPDDLLSSSQPLDVSELGDDNDTFASPNSSNSIV